MGFYRKFIVGNFRNHILLPSILLILYVNMKTVFTKPPAYFKFIAANSPIAILADVVRKTGGQMKEELAHLAEFRHKLLLLKQYIEKAFAAPKPTLEFSPIQCGLF